MAVTVETPEGQISDAVLAETMSVTLRPKTSSQQKEKDKSTKRKSNLNRALTEEQVVSATQTESNGKCLNFYLKKKIQIDSG